MSQCYASCNNVSDWQIGLDWTGLPPTQKGLICVIIQLLQHSISILHY